jgi:hypothetical protein
LEHTIGAPAKLLTGATTQVSSACVPDAEGFGTDSTVEEPAAKTPRQRVLVPQVSDAVDEGAEHFCIASEHGDAEGTDSYDSTVPAAKPDSAIFASDRELLDQQETARQVYDIMSAASAQLEWLQRNANIQKEPPPQLDTG